VSGRDGRKESRTNEAGIGRHHGVNLGVLVLVVDQRSFPRVGVDLSVESSSDAWSNGLWEGQVSKETRPLNGSD
jgi:hypothetical protein